MTQHTLATRPGKGHEMLTPARPLCSALHILLRTHAEVPCPGDHEACNSTFTPALAAHVTESR